MASGGSLFLGLQRTHGGSVTDPVLVLNLNDNPIKFLKGNQVPGQSRHPGDSGSMPRHGLPKTDKQGGYFARRQPYMRRQLFQRIQSIPLNSPLISAWCIKEGNIPRRQSGSKQPSKGLDWHCPKSL